MRTAEGLLIVDKPTGITSHGVVVQVRRFAPGLRVGHTGTLDPFATGVLPVCIGRATRLARFLCASHKVYAGAIRLGVVTDTYDREGRVVQRAETGGLEESAIRRAAARFVGHLMQTPPPFSARKFKGQRLHRLARMGRAVTPRPSPVTIHRLDILETAGPIVTFQAETSPGTYIRALAHDLGVALGCGAHLAELRRLAVGKLRIQDAHAWDEILERGRAGTLGEITIPLPEIDLGLPTVTVTSAGLAAMRSGRTLSARELLDPEQVPPPAGAGRTGPVRVQDEAGNLLGVAVPPRDRLDGAILQPDVVLVA